MDYSGINSKIKAMRSNLFKYQDYFELSKLISVEDIAHKLENFPVYKKFVSQLDSQHLHRGNIESKLALSLMSDFERIYNFIPDYELKKYLGAFFLRNEIHFIKLILCMICDKRDIEYSLPELNFLIGKKLRINVDKLKNSSSIEEFINNLRGTEFYNLLNELYSHSHNLFELEMKLDLYYYMHLWKLQKKYLHGKNKLILSKIKGTEIDLINISWIYRMKKYYNFDSAILFSYLIPNKYKLTAEEISSLVAANTMSEFEKIVYNTYYGSLFENKNVKIERVLYNCLSKIYYRFYVRAGANISYVVYYIYLKEIEVNNITSIIEGIRYGLESQKILGYLYLKEV